MTLILTDSMIPLPMNGNFHSFISSSLICCPPQEHFRDPLPGTPAGATPSGSRSNRTPYGGVTPGGSRSAGGITPGAMSLAGANTPYGQTPGFSRSAPYTPTANTPFMTPFTTPGPSATPKSGYGGGTPRQPGASPAPPRQSKGGNMWGAAASAWAGGSQSQRHSRGGEQSTILSCDKSFIPSCRL